MKSLILSQYGFALPLAAVLLIVPRAGAGERLNAPAIVTRTCSGCHGLDGKSQLPYIPRLAGLSAAYIELKLTVFRDASSSPVDEAFSRVVHMGSPGKDAGITAAATAQMVGVAHAISDADKKAAAQWFAAQTPAPGKSGRRELIEEGKSLFVNGLQSQGVPACQTCHGAEAQGTGIAPRLAGQNGSYVVRQMALFRAGDRRNSPEMTAVGRNVEGAQARAVAAYLQSR
jgi:cytochrome c553